MNERPSGPGSAMANFLIEELPTLDMTNQEIADRLGYARPNIVSMWKAGKTKVTIDHVFALAEMVGVDPSYILALFIDQYVSEWSGVDRFNDIVSMMQRLVTPDEMELIQIVREARRFNSMPLTDEQRKALKGLFEVEITTPEGPYRPVETKDGVPRIGDRRRFARRGHARDLTVSEIEELEARRASESETEAEKPVRKRAPRKAKTDTRESK
jgi:plasmid maintenance system antidote protein VapI